MAKYLKWLFPVGALLYLLVALSTYHPDLRAFLLAGKFIRQGEIFTFYDHLSKSPVGDSYKSLYGDDLFIYPPLAYLIPSLIHLPFSGLLSADIDTLLLHDSALLDGRLWHLPLLIYKLPALIFSFLTFLFLPRLFKDPQKGRLAQGLWLLAPVNLLVAAGMGQADSILVFFLLCSLISAKNKQYSLAAVFASLSALVKPFALVFLPVIILAAYKKSGFRTAVISALAGVGTWLLFILPFLPSPAFRMYALLASLAGKSAYAGITIAAGTTIPWLYIFYLVILLQLFTGRLSLINSLGLTTLSTLAFTHFHPQWFLWVVPWLIFFTVQKQKVFFFFWLMLAWCFIWLSFDASLHLGLLTAVRNNFSPSFFLPLSGSVLVLFSRASLVAGLIWQLL